jgi:hypothetical protein
MSSTKTLHKTSPFVGSIKELVCLKTGTGYYLQKMYVDFNYEPYVGTYIRIRSVGFGDYVISTS